MDRWRWLMSRSRLPRGLGCHWLLCWVARHDAHRQSVLLYARCCDHHCRRRARGNVLRVLLGRRDRALDREDRSGHRGHLGRCDFALCHDPLHCCLASLCA
eukprot:Amastigsp_a678233_1028.p4 type:complete len:101 gc:universal Amastigsp_a678233_1028:425-123(-)